VTVHDQVQLPAGPLYAMVARHQNGPSSWVIGYSNLTKRIEYANFNLTGQPQVLPRPLPPPGPVGQPGPPPQSAPVPNPGQVAQPGTVPPPNPPANPSPACQRFPNLC
jgi:hypothetical protein